MKLIDTHAHLTDPALLPQIDDVIARAAEAGVARIITVGTDPSDAEAAICLTRRFPGVVFVAVGIHPHEAARVSESDVAAICALLDVEHVVGFGEMGLDYHYDFADRASQHRVFAAQLQHARQRDLPVIIHSREAFDDTASLLIEHGMEGKPVVFHCFTGTPEEARRIAQHGWRISFTGVVTFNSAKDLHGIAAEYPMNHLMVETDSPYLSPVPVRNVRPNEPSHVVHTARFIADLKDIAPDELASRTWTNSCAFFGLK